MSLVAVMYFSVLVDFVVGLVPIIGDLGDAAYKANTKNAARLEQHLREKGKISLRTAGQAIPELDPSDPDQFEHFQESGVAPAAATPAGQPMPNIRHGNGQPEIPAPAVTKSGRGFFGSLRKSRPEADVERGQH